MMSAEMIVMVAPEDKDCIHEPILFNGGPMGTFDNVWRYFWLSQLGGWQKDAVLLASCG